MISLVIPVYKNEANIPALLDALTKLDGALSCGLEVVFVVDGSPDDSHAVLYRTLPETKLRAQLVLLSRNFGSFAAIRAGLQLARGDRFAVMAADLQEPPELILEFDRVLQEGQADVVVGERIGRKDPLFSRLFSGMFWGTYRRFIDNRVPPGGADVFACTRDVRDQLLQLSENNSSLIGLLFWVGFRLARVPYERRQREIGNSAWTFAKKLRYLSDSIYSFTDLPIRLLTRIGLVGLAVSAVFSAVVVAQKIFGTFPIPGYAATVMVVTFFGALNCFGLGVIGNYVWRSFENTKGRPNYIVATQRDFGTSKQEG